MKITNLTIQPNRSWEPISARNPLKATVKLASETATVETIIPDDMMEPLLRLVADIVSRAAVQNVADFALDVQALDVPQVTA